MSYDIYKEQIVLDINNCMEGLQVQPILFIGSGLSQRYFNAPDWDGLMKHLADNCPLITKKYAYYQQRNQHDNTKIASCFSDSYSDWAWGEGEERYPSNYFESNTSQDIYMKHEVSQYISSLAKNFSVENHTLNSEIKELQRVKPHAIITTNYDNAIEKMFPDYHRVIGQEVVRANYTSYGEILKIHGCSSEISTMVLTAEDYENFNSKKKYLSAKLLTYFAEHPLFFFGYSLTDENIKGILSDIDEILAPNDELIPNIYMVCFNKQAEETGEHPKEQLISIDGSRSVRLKVIFAKDFEWIFSALSSCTPEITVNPRLIRSLLARTYKLASSNLPRQELSFNFEMLKDIADSDDKLPTLYGIAEINSAQELNYNFDYTISDIANELNVRSWYQVNKIIEGIESDKGLNIKKSDNKYHIEIKTGKKSVVKKYSKDAISLFEKFLRGEEYTLDI